MSIPNLKRMNKPQVKDSAPSRLEQELDEKAARMLDIYANRRFRSLQASQRMRLTLLIWVIRNKLAGNLKRMLDFVFALGMVVLASPLMLLTALAIKLDSPGPILFRQTRVGKW